MGFQGRRIVRADRNMAPSAYAVLNLCEHSYTRKAHSNRSESLRLTWRAVLTGTRGNAVEYSERTPLEIKRPSARPWVRYQDRLCICIVPLLYTGKTVHLFFCQVKFLCGDYFWTWPVKCLNKVDKSNITLDDSCVGTVLNLYS